MRRMVSLLTSVVVLLLCVIYDASADEEVSPYAYVTGAEGGRYYFKMSPDPAERWDRDKGFGIAYEVVAGKADKTLWSIQGWYAFSVFLSADGTYLVRLGNWPRGHQPSEDHLAVAFYQQDQLLKSYSTRDLIRDDSKVRPSVSHYQFLSEEETPGFLGFETFRLVTVDGITYEFDIRSGEIVSRTDEN